MADVAENQGLTPEETAHRARIARSETWTEEEAEEAWREARSSARMLGCALTATLAVVLGIALAVVGPPLVDAVVTWLSN